MSIVPSIISENELPFLEKIIIDGYESFEQFANDPKFKAHFTSRSNSKELFLTKSPFKIIWPTLSILAYNFFYKIQSLCLKETNDRLIEFVFHFSWLAKEIYYPSSVIAHSNEKPLPIAKSLTSSTKKEWLITTFKVSKSAQKSLIKNRVL